MNTNKIKVERTKNLLYNVLIIFGEWLKYNN